MVISLETVLPPGYSKHQSLEMTSHGGAKLFPMTTLITQLKMKEK